MLQREGEDCLRPFVGLCVAMEATMKVFEAIRILDRNGRFAPKVLDADGVDTSVGDTVYDVDTGEKMWVSALPEQGAYQCVKLRLINGMFKTLDPCRFTHERPENKCRDCAHWQKDPTADNMGVCWFFYHEYEGQDCYAARRADIGACEEFMPRASALAERERGE